MGQRFLRKNELIPLFPSFLPLYQAFLQEDYCKREKYKVLIEAERAVCLCGKLL